MGMEPRALMSPCRENCLDVTAKLLLPLYAEPHRAYHNATHVQALLKLADAHADLMRDSLAVRLAIWFHDAVYDTARPDNEERSACLADRTLSEWNCDVPLISSVVSKVRATAGHRWKDGDPDTALFLDFDLSVLAAPEPVYDQYARQIAEEYAWLPGGVYRAGRIKVLEGFVTRPRLYFTERFSAQWEALARANLQREMHSLNEGGPCL